MNPFRDKLMFEKKIPGISIEVFITILLFIHEKYYDKIIDQSLKICTQFINI